MGVGGGDLIEAFTFHKTSPLRKSRFLLDNQKKIMVEPDRPQRVI